MSLRSPDSLPSGKSLIDALLEEESDLTAASRFARWHTRQESSPPPETGPPTYRHLIPLQAPAPGEQYAFEVDLDACSGCKACVTACHSLNGLDDDEAWRSVGLLITPTTPSGLDLAPAKLPAIQHVTTACHHCVDPACLSGCPVLAYHKDPVTGVVRHLDDQCIGCTYCVMTCPYEVPKFSKRLGIVRKCDLCHGRLAAGEAPACAQSCPNGAIRIRTVPITRLVETTRPHSSRPPALQSPSRNPFLPAAPPPSITLPTTRYISQRVSADGASYRAADEARVVPGPPHTPLVALLILSQSAAGLFLASTLLPVTARTGPAWLGFGLLCAGLAASVLHLGQPLRAWRVFLGLRTSWLSREAMLLGGFAALAFTYCVVPFLIRRSPGNLFLMATAAAGLIGVHSSVMVYAVTQRDFWQLKHTAARFFGAAVSVGATWALAASHASQTSHASPATRAVLAAAATLGLMVSLMSEASVFRHRRGHQWTPLRRTASLLTGKLNRRWRARCLAAAYGLLAVFASFGFNGVSALFLSAAGGGLLLAGALFERHLYFTAASPHRMPGGISS